MGKTFRKSGVLGGPRPEVPFDQLPSAESVDSIEVRAKAAAERLVSVQIRMPASLRSALQSDAARKETSMNAIILAGIKELGYKIPPKILEDRRRLKK